MGRGSWTTASGPLANDLGRWSVSTGARRAAANRFTDSSTENAARSHESIGVVGNRGRWIRYRHPRERPGCLCSSVLRDTQPVNPIARVLNRLLGLLKWPVALAALIFLPGLVYALYFVIRGIVANPGNCVPFLIGAGAYGAVYIGFAGRRVGFWTILEHELTHVLFALATFHRVVGFSAMRAGGHVRYIGSGNWLIAIAPYFFPLFTLVVIAVLTLLPPRHLAVGAGVLGASVAHHVLSTWSETHRHQTDLRETGWLWNWLFLPSVNAFVLGIVLSYAAGTRSLTAHLSHVREPSLAFFSLLARLLPG